MRRGAPGVQDPAGRNESKRPTEPRPAAAPLDVFVVQEEAPIDRTHLAHERGRPCRSATGDRLEFGRLSMLERFVAQTV